MTGVPGYDERNLFRGSMNDLSSPFTSIFAVKSFPIPRETVFDEETKGSLRIDKRSSVDGSVLVFDVIVVGVVGFFNTDSMVEAIEADSTLQGANGFRFRTEVVIVDDVVDFP